jgi:hypothetical protein
MRLLSLFLTFDVFAEPTFGVPNGTLTESGLLNATDGNLATGYLVTASPGDANRSQGLRVRWDFDVSGYASITSFLFSFDGILNDPSGFDDLRIGSSPSSNFKVIAAADGIQVGTTLSLTSGAALGSNNLDNYLSGGLLSVFIQTEFGDGPASLGATVLNTLEISGNIDGVLATIPVPTTIWLFGSALIGLIGIGKRKTDMST